MLTMSRYWESCVKINLKFLLMLGFLLGLFSQIVQAHDKYSASEHLEMGEELYQAKDYDKALDEFRKAVEDNPGMLKGWENIGWAQWTLNNVDETIRVWENLCLVKPTDVKLLNSLAKAYTVKGDFVKAAELYDESLAIDPEQKNIIFNRAKILGWSRRFDEAVVKLNQLIEADPQNDAVREQLARFLAGMANYQESLIHWKILVDKYPQEIKYQLGMYITLYQLEQYDEALKILNGILKMDPQNLDAAYLFAKDALYQYDYVRAQSFLKEVASKDLNHPSILMELLKISLKLEDYSEAIKAARSLLVQHPDNLDVCVSLADALRLNGDTIGTLREYKKILQDNPNNFPTHNGLKELAIDTKFYENALNQINFLLKMDPSNLNLK